MTFGEKVRILRKERHMSQQELGDALGFSQSCIAAYENGVRKTPSFERIGKIADFFGVPASSFMPSDNVTDSDFYCQIANLINSNKKYRILFDKARSLSESDLDTVIMVIKSIQK